MAGKSSLALPRTRIPDFHHAVFAAGDEAQVICRQRPDAFDVAEEGPDAGLCSGSVGVGERVCGEDDEGVGSVFGGLVLVLLVLLRLLLLLLALGMRLVGIPQTDGGVEGTREHVAWRSCTFGIV